MVARHHEHADSRACQGGELFGHEKMVLLLAVLREITRDEEELHAQPFDLPQRRLEDLPAFGEQLPVAVHVGLERGPLRSQGRVVQVRIAEDREARRWIRGGRLRQDQAPVGRSAIADAGARAQDRGEREDRRGRPGTGVQQTAVVHSM